MLNDLEKTGEFCGQDNNGADGQSQKVMQDWGEGRLITFHGTGQGGRGGIQTAGKCIAHAGQSADGCDNDQCSNEAIFNSSSAGF